jgi:alanyl-tRNA synthetase
MTKQYYFDDPLCLEFQAEVAEVFTDKDGKICAILIGTYFYPTSGGQDHDIGLIHNAKVLDVYKGLDNTIIHVLDKEISPGVYPASIDKVRRKQNMQSHTAQHVLSRSFELLLNLETLSANINFDSPSTIDLDADNLLESDLDLVENLANSLIFENRQVKSYYIKDEDIPNISFRRPPKVAGTIRVIEVDGFDYSACGGTHCPYTGMIGLIKILKIEMQNHKIRVHFVAGSQAMGVFKSVYHTAKKISGILETNLADLVKSVAQQVETQKFQRIELDDYKNKLLLIEKTQLYESVRMIEKIKLITKFFSDKSPEELRKLVSMICLDEDYVVILAGLIGNKLSMVVGCSQKINLDARKLLDQHLKKFNGHGGGDQNLAQGGCTFLEKNGNDIFSDTINIIKENHFSEK